MEYLRQLVVRVKDGLLAGVLLSISLPGLAADKDARPALAPLPDPLTLKQAIEFSDTNHPDLEIVTSTEAKPGFGKPNLKTDST